MKKGTNTKILSVSIIIAARNEEENIVGCLNHVLNQNYPKEFYEVIVIDDRSRDRTAEIIKEWQKKQGNLRLLQIKEAYREISPKKHAIETGIRNAQGEIIFTTDADCTPGPNWLRESIRQFGPEVGLVAGYNPYIAKNSMNLLQKMLTLDYFSMAAVAAGSCGLHFPISCSGGNLAYRKALFERLGGFGKRKRIQSGDDDLFLQRVRDETNHQIIYSLSPETFVPTLPPETVSEFVHQRLRYASKGILYKPKVLFILSAIFCLNLLITCGYFFIFVSPKIALPLLVAIFLKAGSEYLFLTKARAAFQVQFQESTFILTALIHPIYITLAAIGGQFLKFRWK